MIVEDFRKYCVYDRSLDLFNSINSLIAKNPDVLRFKEIKSLQRETMVITKLLASGIGQVNLKIRVSKFNDAKRKLERIEQLLICLLRQRKIDQLSLYDIESYRLQLIKLLNGYFGWLKSNKHY